jgi:hypothetical protein
MIPFEEKHFSGTIPPFPKENLCFPPWEAQILLYVKGQRIDECYEVARLVIKGIGKENISKIEETHGFKYLDGRDLTG